MGLSFSSFVQEGEVDSRSELARVAAGYAQLFCVAALRFCINAKPALMRKCLTAKGVNFHVASRNSDAQFVHLFPELSFAIDLTVVLKDTLQLELVISLHPGR